MPFQLVWASLFAPPSSVCDLIGCVVARRQFGMCYSRTIFSHELRFVVRSGCCAPSIIRAPILIGGVNIVQSNGMCIQLTSDNANVRSFVEGVLGQWLACDGSTAAKQTDPGSNPGHVRVKFYLEAFLS